MNSILINPVTDQQLSELAFKRKKEFSPIKTKQQIAAQAVALLYRKELSHGKK